MQCPVCGSATITDVSGHEHCPTCHARVTDDDLLEPVYCRGCHRRLLRAQFVDDHLCRACITQRQQEEAARAQAEQERSRARLKREEARIAEFRNRDTGMGACPQCGARNIKQFSTGSNATGIMGCTACAGCMFWPLWLMLPVLPFLQRGTPHRECRVCGYQWLV